MNDKGEIKTFKSDDEAKAAGFDEKLTREESRKLMEVSEEDRKLELLWLRFWSYQKLHYRPDKERAMRFAFLKGCQVMLEIAGNMAKEETTDATKA